MTGPKQKTACPVWAKYQVPPLRLRWTTLASTGERGAGGITRAPGRDNNKSMLTKPFIATYLPIYVHEPVVMNPANPTT